MTTRDKPLGKLHLWWLREFAKCDGGRMATGGHRGAYGAAFKTLCERDMIRERTLAGMAAARERGAKFGAPRKLDLAGARELFRAGKTVREVAEHFDCSRSAVYNQFKFDEIERLRKAGARKRTK